MLEQKHSKPKTKRRKGKRKKNKDRQRRRRRGGKVQIERRKRRRRRSKRLRWDARPGGAKSSFEHLHLFLLALNIPLIASQTETLAAFVVAALLANSCHLPQIAAFMPLQIRQRSRLRRLERFLDSRKVEPMAVMAPVARWLLKQVETPCLYLVLDFTTKKDLFLIAMVSLVWGKRTIPLAWIIGLANTKGVSRRALAEQVVRLVAEWIPKHESVIFIADREFRGTHWRRLFEKELHWHFVIRLSADRTFVYLPDGSVCRLCDLKVQKGEARYWKGVYLTLQKDGPYQLAAVWAKEADEPWLLISDLADPKVLPDIYGRRWGIESTFRDLKSYGFDLEASRIEDLDRFHRLLLGLALAYGWAVRIGHWLDQSGQRLLVDRGRTPKQSAYRLGRYWLVHLWIVESERIEEVHFASVPT